LYLSKEKQGYGDQPSKVTQSAVAALLELHHLQCTQSIAGVLRKAFAAVGADEGTIWLLDETQEVLIPVWSSGSYGERFVGIHRQPLTAGLMSLICVTEQALCENSVYQNEQQDPTLDRRLGVLTCAMIAVPLRFRDAIHGGISCVRLKPMDAADELEPPPFSARDLAVVTDAVREVERLIEAA
jgi:GAF domain